MKIAIPTREHLVDDHHGHYEYYTIFNIAEDKQIENEEVLMAPRECRHRTNIAGFLKDKGVEMLLTGEIGPGTCQKIEQSGISIVKGCNGEVRKVVESFLKGELN